MEQQTFRILLTGGGSGGPTTPLIAVYEALVNRLGKENVDCSFWGTKTGPERGMVEKVNIPFESLPSGKLRRYWSWQNFIDPLFILFAFFVSIKRLLIHRPHVVVSAGSFVSVPVAYAAWMLRIPHVIFQMDVKPGLANRLMAFPSSVLVYLFEQTAKHFSVNDKKKIGPVVRSEICDASGERANTPFNLTPDKSVLLVTGGGQGALKINQAVEGMLDHWLEKYQVVHLTGSNLSGANCQHPDYHPISFIHEGMGDLLARSDLVITRAGLGIIGELAQLAKDTILVPIPGTHQELNAKLLTDHQAATLFPQQEFLENGQQWWDTFIESYHPGELGKNLQQFLPPKGAEDFAEILLSQSHFAK